MFMIRKASVRAVSPGRTAGRSPLAGSTTTSSTSWTRTDAVFEVTLTVAPFAVYVAVAAVPIRAPADVPLASAVQGSHITVITAATVRLR